MNASRNPKEFWERTRALLHVTLPLEYCCLNFRPYVGMPATALRERAPFASEQELLRFCEISPFTWWVREHPGSKILRLSSLIGASQLLDSAYFREFMEPTNSRYEVCLIFWDGEIFEGAIGLHRASRHGDFSDSELGFLERLYPHFQNAMRRLTRAQQEKARRISLESLLDRLPLATIILDWDLRTTYRNRAAEEIGNLWNLGAQAARCLKPHPSFDVPAEIMEGCERIKAKRFNDAGRPSLLESTDLVVEHNRDKALRATIALVPMDKAPLSPPMFLIRLENRNDFPGETGMDPGRLALWVRLSPSEQHVAWLASKGHRNIEIAKQLSKSVLTVKKQLQRIYQKLEVSGRTRLIALLN